MNFFKTCLILGSACYFLSCQDVKVSNKEAEPAEQYLLDVIAQFNTAFRNGDVASLSSMITENYTHTNSTSKAIGKADWLNYMSKREADIVSGNLAVIDYKMDDVEIQYFGKTAIVTGKVVVSTREKEELRINEYRITNVWVNKNGNWKRAGFHDSKIK